MNTNTAAAVTTVYVRPVKGLTGETEFFWTVFGPTATNPKALLASGVAATEDDALDAATAVRA